MIEWINCNDRLPIIAKDGQSFETMEVLVTDGKHVHATDFRAGGIPIAWSEFDSYGAIAKSQITHWMPFPEPPK